MDGSDEEDLDEKAMHVMKYYLALFVALCFGLESQARLMQTWNYNMLNDKATLVVIAKATQVSPTSERAALPNIIAGTNEVIAAGVETSFKVLTVLKGDRNLQTFVLHHYTPIPSKELSLNGPNLVSFEPKDGKTFLLFLQQEADGRYVAVSGQTDPFWSVSEFAGPLPHLLAPDIDMKNAKQF
ncbi:MAG TPA: hypothetical protein VK815_02690 [Candidatus Acidoferrales bacterium]|nr:hypothetical protein [Candidatus Acidoferrales bacterium]